MAIIEDLERIQLRLEVEAALCECDSALSKRLRDLSVEATDALEKLREMARRAVELQPNLAALSPGSLPPLRETKNTNDSDGLSVP